MKHGKITSNQISYLHGYFEAKIEGFAKSADVPADELALRVGSVLYSASGGSVLGNRSNRVQRMSRAPASVSQGKRGEVAVGSRSRNYGASVKAPSGKRKESSIKAYWARMTPEQRKEEVIRRQAVATKRKKAAA